MPFVVSLLLPFGMAIANPEHTAMFSGDAVAGREHADAAAELKRLRTVFNALKSPPIKGKRWVVVDRPIANKITLRGWLLEDGPASVAILTEVGSQQTLAKPKKGAQRPDKDAGQDNVWSMREGDFAAHCKEVLADHAAGRKIDPTDNTWDATGRFGYGAAVVGLARLADWLSELGDDNRARQMARVAIAARDEVAAKHGIPPHDSLAQFVAYHLVAGGWQTAIEDAYASRPRPELIKQYQVLAAIPLHPYAKRIEEEQRAYQSLFAEDRKWKEPDANTLAQRTPQQKAAYWMYHLRDLRRTGHDSTGACHLLWRQFLDPPGPNPAIELMNLGYDALPEVIAHLDDLRPTRCKESVGWRGAAYLLTYGDCCEQIFSAVTGVRLSQSGFGEARASKGEHKARAEKWWQDFQKKGEKQVLIEATAGGGDAWVQADRLAKKYPKDALAALATGIRATDNEQSRWDLLGVMRTLKDERVVAFLREELKGASLRCRAGAAMGLLERGQDDGVAVLAKEWESLDLKDFSRTHYAWGEKVFDRAGVDAVVQALAKSGKVAGVSALEKRMASLPAPFKQSIIGYLGEADKDFAGKAPSADLNAAIDRLLVGCLDDRTKNDQVSGTKRDNSNTYRQYAYPRTCDVAAEVLVARWKQPQLFDFFGTVENRDAQIVGLKRIWQKKQPNQP
jgi:hypothetical protein